MTTKELMERAKAVSYVAHLGQVDKSGVPYYLHPARVGENFKVDEYELRAVAYLHDVLEDTELTVSDLITLGFSPEIISSVIALTRVSNEQPDAYYARVRKNSVAKLVKFSDIEDNTNPKRLALLPKETADRLVRKYIHALNELRKDD